MPTYRIQLVCERDPEPITGEILEREEETLEVVASEPWDAFRKATTQMTIRPRGRLLQGFDFDTGEPIRPPTGREPFRQSYFEIADVQGPYAGFTRGETWNGWAVPYFRKEDALQITRDFERESRDQGGYIAGARAHYDEDADAFLFYDPINDDEVAYESVMIKVAGVEVKAYPVGTREWTWEEVADAI